MKQLIEKYEQKVQNASRTTETDEELAYALHSLFKDLFKALWIRCGEITLKDFLHTELTKDLGQPGYIAVYQIAEKSFEIVIGTNELIDESRTARHQIDDLTITVRESIGLIAGLIRKVDENRLKALIAEYEELVK